MTRTSTASRDATSATALAFHLVPEQATITLPADSSAGAFHRGIVEVVGQQSVPEIQRAGRHNGRVEPQRADVGFRHGPAEGQFPGDEAPAGQQQFGTPAGRRPAGGNRVDGLQRHWHQGHFPLLQLAGDLGGRRAAVQPDVAAVLEQGGDAGRNPHLGGMVLEFALAVLGVLAPQHETPGTAVDPAENPVELQHVQVAPDRGTRGAAFGHELIDAHVLPVAQQLADAAVPLVSVHVQMLTQRDHLIICCAAAP